MVLTLTDLERIREDAMAEDIDIEDRMLNWTEEQATTFFENGGEEEHEMTAWLRDHSCVQYDAQFRYQFQTVEAMRAHVAAGGPDSIIELLDKCVPRSDYRERTKLRKVLEVFGGHAEAPLPPAPQGQAVAHQKPGASPLAVGKKVIFVNLTSEPDLNNKVGEVMPPHFDDPAAGGMYTVKIMHAVTGQAVTGRAQNNEKTLRRVRPEKLILHPDQVEKDRLESEEGAIVLVGGSEADREARAALYSMRLDPQHYYDQAIERVFAAKHEFEVLAIEPKWHGDDMRPIKRAYRKISATVHPDKNGHPQAVDAFRKVYGAFETLLELRSQWRILFVLGKLSGDEASLFDMEAEEDEKFEWWWKANVSEIERQAAEAEGGEFEDIGEKWISDGVGGDVNEVQWQSLTAALRLHTTQGAIFLDCRERWEFDIEHIAGAYSVPMREFVDFGLQGVYGEWVSQVLKTRAADPPVPIIIYSEVATPFSRCRALCRWLLRAGSSGAITPARLRRLRGGMFGWKYQKGPVRRRHYARRVDANRSRPTVTTAHASRDLIISRTRSPQLAPSAFTRAALCGTGDSRVDVRVSRGACSPQGSGVHQRGQPTATNAAVQPARPGGAAARTRARWREGGAVPSRGLVGTSLLRGRRPTADGLPHDPGGGGRGPARAHRAWRAHQDDRTPSPRRARPGRDN